MKAIDQLHWLAVLCVLYNIKGSYTQQCTFPFYVGNIQHSKCVKEVNSGRYWCSSATNYNNINQKVICCRPPDEVEHATLLASCTLAPRRDCFYTCNDGYQLLNGISKRYCRAALQPYWGSPPTCIMYKCVESPVTNGMRMEKQGCSNFEEENSVCTYKCTDPYKQAPITILKSTCTDVGGILAFRPALLPCYIMRCRDPQIPDDFNVQRLECTDHYNLNSVCAVICKKNFYLEKGPNYKVQCREGLFDEEYFYKWNVNFRPCNQKSSCTKPLDLPHSTYTCTNKFFYESQCTYKCENGYAEKGATTIQCDINLQWSPLLQMPCQRKNCNDPPAAPANGVLIYCSSPGKLLHSKCVYECKPGYTLQGDKTVTKCQADGDTMRWDSIDMICNAPKCTKEHMPKQRNGKLKACSMDVNIDSVCEFQCNSGYELPANGINKTTCFWDEKTTVPDWKNVLTPCEEKKCSISNQVNGHEGDCTDRERPLGAKCRFDCNPGYQLIDPKINIIECILDENGGVKWNGNPSDCEPRICDPVLVPAFASKDICSERFLTSCSFVCIAGYKFPPNAVKSITCKLDSAGDYQWDNKPSACIRQVCEPANQTNGFEHYCTHSIRYFGVHCYFACSPGYFLPKGGVAGVKCVAAGDTSDSGVTWSKTLTDCKKKSCEPIYQPFGHEVDKCSNEFDTTCRFDCDAGYMLPANGKRQAKCIYDKHLGMVWNAEMSTCIPQKCPKAKQTNGYEYVCTVTTRDYLSACYFACNDGYFLPKGGNNRVDCILADNTLTSGVKWQGKLTACQKMSCYPTFQKFGSEVAKCNNKFNSVCEFRCNDGYQLPKNGVAKAKCTYNKKLGIMVWSNELTACERRRCPVPRAVGTHNLFCDDEHLFLSLCDFQCDPGYVLEGKKFQRIRCEVEGDKMTWKPALTPCKRRTCSALTQKNGHFVHCSSQAEKYLYKDTCSMACNKGFTLPSDGADSSTCTADVYPGIAILRWNHSLTDCIRRNCTLNLKRGTLLDICSNHQQYESECIFQCEPGFAFKAKPRAKCDVNQKDAMVWKPAHPICNRRSCAKLTLDKANEMTCKGNYKFESTCLFQCIRGYTFPTDGTPVVDNATCVVNSKDEMRWNNKLTACQTMKCPKIHQVNGKVNQCNGNYEDKTVCLYECLLGYKLPDGGTNKITCKLTPENTIGWQGNLTDCEVRQCPKWNAPHGVIVKCTSGSEYLSVCQTSCIPGYGFSGENSMASVNCSAKTNPNVNATEMFWTDAPECKILTCPKPIVDKGKEIRCDSGYVFGSMCSFKCHDGYKFPDDREIGVISCAAQSPQGVAWDKKLICEARRCKPMIVPNSHIFKCTSGFQYRSVCTLLCNRGYRFEKGYNDAIICLYKKIEDNFEMYWNDTSKCTELNCTQIAVPEGTTMFCTEGERHGSTCTASCDPGYSAAVNTPYSVTCQATCDPSVSHANKKCVYGPIVDKHFPLDWNGSIATLCKDIDECASFPCMNNGTCLNAKQMYVCECGTMATGVNCETDFDADGSSDWFGGYKNEVVYTLIASAVLATTGIIGAAIWLLKSNSVLAKSLLAKIIAFFRRF